jgi:hypothetical protein
LIPQDSAQGLAVVSAMFNNVIHGEDSNLVVQGAGVTPSDVSIHIRALLPSLDTSFAGHLARRRYPGSADQHRTSEFGTVEHYKIHHFKRSDTHVLQEAGLQSTCEHPLHRCGIYSAVCFPNRHRCCRAGYYRWCRWPGYRSTQRSKRT